MPKIVDRTAYRGELLAGAVDLFAEHGYRGLSMRRIAAGLGVSTGTLYHYFDSKEDLFLRVVEHLTDLLAERLVAVVRAPSVVATPRGRLEALLEDVAGDEDWYARYNRLCLDYLRERHARDTRVMAATMERAEAVLAETLAVEAPAARFLLVALFGLVTQRDLDGGDTPFRDQALLLLEWFDVHASA